MLKAPDAMFVRMNEKVWNTDDGGGMNPSLIKPAGVKDVGRWGPNVCQGRATRRVDAREGS